MQGHFTQCEHTISSKRKSAAVSTEALLLFAMIASFGGNSTLMRVGVCSQRIVHQRLVTLFCLGRHLLEIHHNIVIKPDCRSNFMWLEKQGGVVPCHGALCKIIKGNVFTSRFFIFHQLAQHGCLANLMGPRYQNGWKLIVQTEKDIFQY
jgi:hypothetical protein